MAFCHMTTITSQAYSQTMVVKIIVQLSIKFDGLYLVKEMHSIVHLQRYINRRRPYSFWTCDMYVFHYENTPMQTALV